MRISTRGRYGLRIMLELALNHGNGPKQVKQIASQQGLSSKYIEQLIAPLKQAGLVTATRGAHGGYRINRQPEEVTFLNLVEVLEGPMQLADCITGKVDDSAGVPCRLMDTCPIADPVHRVHRKIRDYLAELTLADVLRGWQEKSDRPFRSAAG